MTTSPGPPRPPWPATTTRPTTSPPALPSRAGHGTDSNAEPSTTRPRSTERTERASSTYVVRSQRATLLISSFRRSASLIDAPISCQLSRAAFSGPFLLGRPEVPGKRWAGAAVADKTGSGHEGRLLLRHAPAGQVGVRGRPTDRSKVSIWAVRQPIRGSGRPRVLAWPSWALVGGGVHLMGA